MLLKKVLLFIPVYNCEKQIYRVLNKLLSIDSKIKYDCIIINNNSNDKTINNINNFFKKERFKNKFCILKNKKNYGLGGSVKIAFNYAIKKKYDYLIMSQGDDQGDPRELFKFYKQEVLIKKNKINLIMGTRFQNFNKIFGYNKLKIVFNILFNFLASIILNKKITDLNSGQFVVNVKILKKKFYMKFSNELWFNYYFFFYFLIEKISFLYKPISWREYDQKSNVKIIKQIFSLFRLLMLVRFKRNFLKKIKYKSINYKFKKIYLN
jgi:glycosyltransferase involved in cell wall biosynthesis